MNEEYFTPRQYFYGFCKLAAVVLLAMVVAWNHIG